MVFKSAEVQEFLARFGVKHRVSSAYNPHFNQLAEGAFKTAKRMLEDNTEAQGTVNTDQITTIDEASIYVKLYSSECFFNLAVAEERTHRRQAVADESIYRRQA